MKMRSLLSYQEAMRVCARVVVGVVDEAVVAGHQSASLVGVIIINDVSPRRVASTLPRLIVIASHRQYYQLTASSYTSDDHNG